MGIPGLVLMENAGRGAFEILVERFPDRLDRVLLLGGPGQNGGDAWVIARHLWLAGYTPRCLLVGERAKVGGDAEVQLRVLHALGVDVAVQPEGTEESFGPWIDPASLVVDGLFGTGLGRPLKGVYAAVVAAANASPVPVIALDVPSGIDADQGVELGSAIEASLTVTFAAHKRGLFRGAGARAAGTVVLASIGAPATPEVSCHRVEPHDARAWLGKRPVDAHKGSSGHLLVVAGAPGTSGAAELTCRGGLRAGAGRVTLAVRPEIHVASEARAVEVMVRPHGNDLAKALALGAKKGAAVVGPGLGTDEVGRSLCRGLALGLPIPTVLDADALSAFEGAALSELAGAAGARVLTPHPGEAGRMLGWDTSVVVERPFAAVETIAKRTGAVVVLKGAGTIVSDGRRSLLVGEPVPALGVAGSGDVLAGILGGLLAERWPVSGLLQRVAAGVYLHNAAGRLTAIGDRGILAREIADAVPRAVAELLLLTR